jgi:hypothetical protein
LEPHLIKTGHIIPLSTGHNGSFSKTELTLYEIHLTNAGFIQDLSQGQAELSGENTGTPEGSDEDVGCDIMAPLSAENELVEIDN